ncbi:helix-turn-helix transcriptional regulator [Chitinophaga sp. SYP-B3965]|uniref:helix-turn-helix domain-containing protein n=1 Tax=Chitinophaga sp. SYP-B3965 TaxID=2663120 RepID=UPI001565CE2B|nr:helix-turn-helix transcriptional regulator [Chitinophaga sp. SYP-B3965]
MLINPAFEDLFTFKNEEEKIEHEAAMISFRILSEVEKLCDDRKIKRKDLAEMTGTSKSYITQLFNGKKSINTYFMAKLENVLNVTFETRLKLNKKSSLVKKELRSGNYDS